MAKQEEPATFSLIKATSGYIIVKMDKSGLAWEQAAEHEAARAMRLAVACLNTGKSDREIYELIEGITP